MVTMNFILKSLTLWCILHFKLQYKCHRLNRFFVWPSPKAEFEWKPPSLADLGACRHAPYGTQFFHFCIHFCRKVPVLGVHAPRTGPRPPTGNPRSATDRDHFRHYIADARQCFWNCLSVSFSLSILISNNPNFIVSVENFVWGIITSRVVIAVIE